MAAVRGSSFPVFLVFGVLTWPACTEPWPQPHWTPLGWTGARLYCPTSVLDHSKALVAEWEQIRAASFQNLVESLKPQEKRLLKPQINYRGLGNEMFSTYKCECNVSVSDPCGHMVCQMASKYYHKYWHLAFELSLFVLRCSATTSSMRSSISHQPISLA